MKATEAKGVYNLNPTRMIMKQGSEPARREASKAGPVREDGPRQMPHAVESDTCTECGDMSHPAMQTRHSHPRNRKHMDGRTDEDQHHAVKHLKGKM